MFSKPDHAVRTLEFSPWWNSFKRSFSLRCFFLEDKSRECNPEREDGKFEITPGTWTSNTSSSPSPRDAALTPLASSITCSSSRKSILERPCCSTFLSWVDNNGSLHRHTTRSWAWTFAKYENAASLMAIFKPPMCVASAGRGVPSKSFLSSKRRYQISAVMVANEKLRSCYSNATSYHNGQTAINEICHKYSCSVTCSGA